MAEQSIPATNAHERILVVDDAADTRLMLNLRLQRAGYTVYAAANGTEALAIVQQKGFPHLVILDILMPGLDGFAVAQALHRMGDMPIIFLSALCDTNTKVAALTQYHAEDFVAKPFAFAELLARIHRVLWRVTVDQVATTESFIDDHLRFNFAEQYAVVDNQRIVLTPIENRLLYSLYSNRGRILSPRFLMAKVWDAAGRGSLEALWVHVHRLRSKIESNPDRPRYVITVSGQGYLLPKEQHIKPLMEGLFGADR